MALTGRTDRRKEDLVDPSNVDREYDRLAEQSRRTADLLRALADKLSARAGQGDPQAREWGLDLREIALAVRDEEQQMKTLLQAMDREADLEVQAVRQQATRTPRTGTAAVTAVDTVAASAAGSSAAASVRPWPWAPGSASVRRSSKTSSDRRRRRRPAGQVRSRTTTGISRSVLVW